jgi:hypothetical protein
MEIIAGNSSHEEFLKPGTELTQADKLTDDELERNLLRLVAAESESTADIVAHIAEFEVRRLYAPKSFPGIFEYCTRVLGYSEGAAYLRIYAGRLSRHYPEILDLLRTRRLHLTAIRTVGPHLNQSNYRELLARSLAKTERELKFVIAAAAPKPEMKEIVRHFPPPRIPPTPMSEHAEVSAIPEPPALSTPAAAPRQVSPVAEAARSRIEPLTPTRVRFAFTGSEEFLRKVDRARELLKHRFPLGALEDVFAATVEFYLQSKDPARKRTPASPRALRRRSRQIPEWVKNSVFARDGGRCTYSSAKGIRCEERGGLEYDHVVPWAKGGASNDPANVRLLCRTHNAWESERIFGRRASR